MYRFLTFSMEAYMHIKNEKDILELIKNDDWMMKILVAAKSLRLPDWWICAGFIRSKIWDTLHEYRTRTPIPDIDVIYFDDQHISEAEEKRLEQKLKLIYPDESWTVKNEARMHFANKIPPYSSSIDAISKFPETATALGVKLNEKNDLILAAPYGVGDLLNLEIKPTNFFKETKERMTIYEKRVAQKNWKAKWDKLKIHHIT